MKTWRRELLVFAMKFSDLQWRASRYHARYGVNRSQERLCSCRGKREGHMTVDKLYQKRMLGDKAAKIVPAGLEQPVGQTLPLAIQHIADALNPERIILFGSYAYGNPTPDSDVDLLVVMKTDAPSKERSWAVSQLLIPRPFPVDVLVRTPEEMAYALAQNDAFIREIVTKGKVLYERGQFSQDA
jgi:predicted nucleotidyltransferase